jgi:hypothetical protein
VKRGRSAKKIPEDGDLKDCRYGLYMGTLFMPPMSSLAFELLRFYLPGQFGLTTQVVANSHELHFQANGGGGSTDYRLPLAGLNVTSLGMR